ncbi:hypothetical protein SteCoe_8542 [Stentor coeruleus]|uniref:Uncharacterized protein n=1 Tax=Stentor coeruleus TaxID=5963 RepID=A0A1R2CJZ7_9CILI|nr:hypothetical protein SteCoe_8542 [Stentor coeruleus]
MADNELEDFILHLNRDAMNYLKEENFSLALKTLKDADKMLSTLDQNSNLKLQAITLNNFGCFYKRINKPNVALKYLQRACEKESVEPVENVNLAGTLLNICAIYSQLGKHEMALENGCKALSLVEKCDKSAPNLVSTLIIGYHNTGVEYEFLNNLKHAVECYKTAWQFAIKQLGEGNQLTISIHKSYIEALEKLEKQETRTSARENFRLTNRVKHSEKRASSGFPPTKKLPNIGPYKKKKLSTPQGKPLPKIPPIIQDKTSDLGHSEKRASSGFPPTKKLPNIGPYKKKKLSTPQGKPLPKIPPIIQDKTSDLGQIRFLTGDRLQPMYQNNGFFSANLKPRTVDIKNKTQNFPLSFKKDAMEFPENNERVQKVPRRMEKIQEGQEMSYESEEPPHNHRTSSAPVYWGKGANIPKPNNSSRPPVAIDVKKLQNRIKHLENQYQDFDKKVKPFKEQLPDLENYKVDKIPGIFDIEKSDKNSNRKTPASRTKNIEDIIDDITVHENKDLIKHLDLSEIPREQENPENITKNTGKKSKTGKNKKVTENANKKTASEDLKPQKDESQKENDGEVPKEQEDQKKPQKKVVFADTVVVKTPLTITQGAFRSYLFQKNLLKHHLAAITIQKHVRRYQCQQIYKEIRSAIIFIQANIRGYLVRKHLNHKLL